MRIEVPKDELVTLLLRVFPGSMLNATHLIEIDFNRSQQSLTFTFDLPRIETPPAIHPVRLNRSKEAAE